MSRDASRSPLGAATPSTDRVPACRGSVWSISGLRRRLRAPVVALGVGLLTSCATYQPQPLRETPLADSLTALEVTAPPRLEAWAGTHPFNPDDGLDLDEVAVLAVLNNPDLKARRAQQAISRAQVFAAGLLPDPQLSAGLDKPTDSGPGLVTAASLGLGYDIVPLITRQARIDAQRQADRKVRLDLLWQEWQVIQKSRSLAVALLLEAQRLQLLHTMLDLYRQRYRHSSTALARGDSTLDVNGTDLTALLDVFSQISQLEQTHNQTRHDFNQLLGLQPDVDVELAPLPQLDPLPAAALTVPRHLLVERRPDLLALRAAYDSQEARVRAAVLGQFPSLGVTVNRARDTGDVKTLGLSVSLTLPLFDGNRGNIAIERATRAQLQLEYQARVSQTESDVDRLLALQAILQRQQGHLERYLPRLEGLVSRARSAYDQGDIQALTFLNMESTWVNKRLEQLSLVQAAWENRIAVAALLALPGYPEAPRASESGPEPARKP